MAAALIAAQQQGSAPAQGTAGKTCNCGMMGGNMGQMGAGNMQHMQQMRARMTQMDAQLDRDVAAMNKATGQAKVDAMSAVLNDMASQHREMRGMMAGMGQGGGMRMGDCPMMSGSGATKPAR